MFKKIEGVELKTVTVPVMNLETSPKGQREAKDMGSILRSQR